MSLTLRNSERRRRKRTDEKLPGGTSARAMAPTQMKLRLRRRGAAAGDAGDAGDAAAGARQPEHEEERTCQSAARSSRRKNSNRASAADASSSPPGSSVSAQAEVMMAEDASPDSKCPICLDRFNNLAYLDRCLHRFCFPCIQEWSHNKAECPLCKQPFASILHSVRAEDDFKEYTLQPAPNNSSVAATVAMVAAMASAARSNHHMRLMLRRHRGGDAGDRRRRRERRGRRRPGSRTGERVAMGEWYLDSSVALPRYASASPILTDSDEADDLDEQRMSDGADSSDGGVIFEGMMRLGGAVVPVSSSNRESRRMMIQLAARRRMQQESGTARHVRERETMAFRRDLYRCGIRVNGVATISNQGQQQQHDITAESFRRNPELLNRLRPWLRRELMVLYGAHGSLVDIIQRIIMARLARHGLEDTPTIEDELRPFLLARTDHFLHELVSFARSPLSLETYDLQAVYEPPTAPLELEAISSSSDSGSIIAISEGEEEQGLLGGDQDRAGCGGSDVIQTRNNLSQSAWDDETPGPSYSAAEPSCSLSSLSFSPTRPEVGQEDEGEREEEEEEEECLIVGYKKPIAERTPELVQLSSDSEEEEPEQEKKEEDKLPVSPSTTAPLPTIPPSTSGMCRNEQEEESKQKAAEVCEQTFCSESSRKSLGDPGGRGHGAEGRRGQRGVKEQQRRRSGTLSNPNRCLYPAMMRRRSSSPFQSSAESSPPDSSWEYSCSQVSPLTSSASSPSRVSWSSSPPRSSPHLTVQGPPTSAATPRECPEKPGGKRKYKSRHLDSNSEDPSWKPKSRSSHRRERRKERKKKERRRRRREEGRKGDKSQRPSQGGGRRSREDRSPSVEIIYEGSVGSNATHKRRRKEDHRRPRGRSPVIITIHSDGSQDGADGGSLLSSQQTLDVSHLLPLPMVLPDGVHQTANAEGGELPVDMLNQEFHGSDQEPPGQTQGSSDHDVDVETVEGNDFLSGSEEAKRSEVVDVDSSSQPAGQSHAEVSDSHLLASILGELQVVAQPKCSFSSSCEGHPSSVTPACDQGPELSQATPDLPPLLKQVSPVRSYSRNTPPPLKRSDAPSPRPRHPDAGTRWSAPGSSSQAASVSAGCFQDFLSSEWQPERREMFSAARRAPADLLWDSSASTVGFPPAACGDAPARSHRNVDLSAPCGAAGSSGVNHSHIVSDDLVPPLECGPDAHPSPAEVNAPAQASSLLIMAANLRCVSSDISSQNPSGSASGDLRDASSLGHEEPPPAAFQQTTGLKRSAAPLAHHTALSSAASSSASTDARPDLLADPQDSPPAVQFH